MHCRMNFSLRERLRGPKQVVRKSCENARNVRRKPSCERCEHFIQIPLFVEISPRKSPILPQNLHIQISDRKSHGLAQKNLNSLFSELYLNADSSKRGLLRSAESRQEPAGKCRFNLWFVWKKNLQGLKRWAWLPKFIDKESAEFSSTLRQAFYCVKPSAEPSCRTPKVP